MGKITEKNYRRTYLLMWHSF